jgi:peptidyl-prolyl cis-trans isomerase SurA
MKKLLVLLSGLLFAVCNFAQEKDPVVLTINGDDIHESEFWYIYSKNNPNPSTKKEDLDAYMELFINYKLKVKEAESLGYDTIPKLQRELKQYRQQLSMPYMIDKEKNEALIQEAYDRIKNEVRASHILIRVAPNASPDDTLTAYNKCIELRDRHAKGEDFGALAKESSEDPSAAYNGGDLGYFSALQMVYPFEDAAFKTKVGEVSMPVRTKFGYHIIKVHDKRASRGRIKVAHIMIISNDKLSDEEKTAAEKKINEIYDLVEKGEDFSELAKKYSDDKSTANIGGFLPEFGAGSKQRMVPEFEAAAFSLESDGDFTKPVKSMYGFHIIKRIELTPVPSYEEMYRELKIKVEKDVRAQSTKESFLNSLKDSYSFKDNADKHLEKFYVSMKEEFIPNEWNGLEGKLDASAVMFSFADQKYTAADLEDHFKNLKVPGKGTPIKKFVEDQYAYVIQKELLDYEDTQLEKKYPEFKSLIQEYRDGILVFEIMQNEVWKKASEDTTGIKNYFESHRSDFTYPIRYKGELYKCKDKATAKRVYNMIKSDTMSYGKIQEVINENSSLNLIVKTQTFNSETTESFKKGKKIRKFKSGLNKAYAFNDEYYIFKVEEIMQPRQREFNEAKGLVTAAYQNQLEQDWLKSLREKYNIEVKQEALYTVGQ